jgi:hypothetical protein
MSILDYINTPFDECPDNIIEAFDDMLQFSITKINDMPVRCELIPSGIVIYLQQFYKHRSSIIWHIHKHTMASCLEELKKLEIDEAGERRTEKNRIESDAYNYIRDSLESANHIEVKDYRCSVCYCFTHRMAHNSLHPVCNRCIVKLDKCPICRIPIE